MRESPGVRFTLLETMPASAAGPTSVLELVLTSGERLRIGNQVNAETLHMLLEAVRG